MLGTQAANICPTHRYYTVFIISFEAIVNPLKRIYIRKATQCRTQLLYLSHTYMHQHMCQNKSSYTCLLLVYPSQACMSLTNHMHHCQTLIPELK